MRVLLADDHALVRAGIRALLAALPEVESVTEAGDRLVAAGSYRIRIGEGQPGTGAPTASGRFTIEGNTSLPE